MFWDIAEIVLLILDMLGIPWLCAHVFIVPYLLLKHSIIVSFGAEHVPCIAITGWFVAFYLVGATHRARWRWRLRWIPSTEHFDKSRGWIETAFGVLVISFILGLMLDATPVEERLEQVGSSVIIGEAYPVA